MTRPNRQNQQYQVSQPYYPPSTKELPTQSEFCRPDLSLNCRPTESSDQGHNLGPSTKGHELSVVASKATSTTPNQELQTGHCGPAPCSDVSARLSRARDISNLSSLLTPTAPIPHQVSTSREPRRPANIHTSTSRTHGCLNNDGSSLPRPSKHHQRRPPPKSISNIYLLSHIWLPTAFSITFIIVLTASLVYSLVKHQVFPVKFLKGLSIAFGIIVPLALFGRIILYCRKRYDDKMHYLAMAKKRDQRDDLEHGNVEGESDSSPISWDSGEWRKGGRDREWIIDVLNEMFRWLKNGLRWIWKSMKRVTVRLEPLRDSYPSNGSDSTGEVERRFNPVGMGGPLGLTRPSDSEIPQHRPKIVSIEPSTNSKEDYLGERMHPQRSPIYSQASLMPRPLEIPRKGSQRPSLVRQLGLTELENTASFATDRNSGPLSTATQAERIPIKSDLTLQNDSTHKSSEWRMQPRTAPLAISNQAKSNHHRSLALTQPVTSQDPNLQLNIQYLSPPKPGSDRTPSTRRKSRPRPASDLLHFTGTEYSASLVYPSPPTSAKSPSSTTGPCQHCTPNGGQSVEHSLLRHTQSQNLAGEKVAKAAEGERQKVRILRLESEIADLEEIADEKPKNLFDDLPEDQKGNFLRDFEAYINRTPISGTEFKQSSRAESHVDSLKRRLKRKPPNLRPSTEGLLELTLDQQRELSCRPLLESENRGTGGTLAEAQVAERAPPNNAWFNGKDMNRCQSLGVCQPSAAVEEQRSMFGRKGSAGETAGPFINETMRVDQKSVSTTDKADIEAFTVSKAEAAAEQANGGPAMRGLRGLSLAEFGCGPIPVPKEIHENEVTRDDDKQANWRLSCGEKETGGRFIESGIWETFIYDI